jgi:hypothetical protein
MKDQTVSGTGLIQGQPFVIEFSSRVPGMKGLEK